MCEVQFKLEKMFKIIVHYLLIISICEWLVSEKRFFRHFPGIGAMAEVKTIVEAAKLALARVDLCKQIDKDS